MKIVSVILSSLVTLLFLSCSDNGVEPTLEYYKTIRKKTAVTSADLNGNVPTAVQLQGDTLYVVATDTGNVSTVELFRYSTLEHLTSLSQWQYDGENSESFGEITALLATDQWLFVGQMGSQVDVFDRKTLQYVTTVGTGNWWGDENFLIVHSFGLGFTDNKLFIRDKHSIRVYDADNFTLENRKKVQKRAESIKLGGNSYKNVHGIALFDNKLYCTDYANKRIYIFQPSDFVEGGADIAPVDSIVLSERPYDIAVHDNALWYVTNENALYQYDIATDEIQKRSILEGHSVDSPRRIAVEGDMLFLVEHAQEELVCAEFEYSEIKIYQ